MSLLAVRPKMNSIFIKIATIIAVTVGLVIGTISVLGDISSKRLAVRFVGQEALFSSSLIGELLAGAVKFGKSEQVASMLETSVDRLDGQMTAALAISATGEPVGQVGTDANEQKNLFLLARKAFESEQPVVAEDGLTVAVPLHFGAGDAVVGAFASSWTPEHMLAASVTASRQVIAWAGVVFLVAVLLAMIVCSRLIVRPLRVFRTAIGDLGAARYDARIPGMRRGDEIGDIGKSLLTLRDQLEAGQETQRDASFKGAAFMGCSAALMVVDAAETIRYLNPNMVSLLKGLRGSISSAGPSSNAVGLIGQPVGKCQVGDIRIDTLLRDKGKQTSKTVFRVGETRLSLTICPVTNDTGDALGHVIEWADVTQDIMNRATIEAIEATQLKAEFTPGGTLISANAAFARVMDASLGQLEGLPLSGMIAGGTDCAASSAEIQSAAEQGKRFTGSVRLARADGSAAIVDVTLTPVCDHQGVPVRFLLLGNDVTDAEAELHSARAAQKDTERQRTEVVEALRVGLEQLSRGNLTATIGNPFSGEFEQLRSDFNGALTNLAKVLSDITRRAENIHNGARDISSTAEGLSRRTETSSATLEETAAALDSLTTSVRTAAAGADQADNAVSAAKANAENSGNVVLETVSAMDQIAESSERITSIIKVIDDIAFQTNLLALNAGVEAARAGDAGRGFAVVASEVRALAQRSSNAAREINDLIAKSANQVKTGVRLVGRTGEALRQIVESVSEISTLVSDIAMSSRQQSASLAEINNAVNQLDQSTQQNAARLEETTAASEALRQDAVALVDSVSHFRVAGAARETAGVVRAQSKTENRPTKVVARAATKSARKTANTVTATPAVEVAASQWEDF